MYHLVILDKEDKLFVVKGQDKETLRVADLFIRGRPEVRDLFKGSWIINTETWEVVATYGKAIEGRRPEEFGYIHGQNAHIAVSAGVEDESVL